MTKSFKIALLLTILVVLSGTEIRSQTSSMGLRLGRFWLNHYHRTSLEGASILFPNLSLPERDNRSRSFAMGGFYELERKSAFYQRFIFQYEENRSNNESNWNLSTGEHVILNLHRSSPSLTGAYSLGRFWQIKRLRFAFGIEAGMTFTPGYVQTELYTFYDSLGAKEGLVSFRSTEIAEYQPYLKWFGSGYYRFSKHFSVGIELTYGLEGYFSKGTKSVVRNNLDPAGNILSTSTEYTEIKKFYINLPANITLPYLGITYLFGDRNIQHPLLAP